MQQTTTDKQLRPWHTLIAEAAHEIAAKHAAKLVSVEGEALLRIPTRDAYRMIFRLDAFPHDHIPCWVDLDGEELAVAEERDPESFRAFLAGKIEPALISYAAACIREAALGLER